MTIAPRIVIVHDYLGQFGGAERVVEEICAVYPDAPVYTSYYSPSRTHASFRERDVRTSWLDRAPGIASHHKAYLPLYPLAFESLRIPPCDVVLSSSAAFAKGVRVPSGAVHVCYCNTPMRFAWRYEDYVAREASVGTISTVLLRPVMAGLRSWDLRANRHVDVFVANSENVRSRIAELYGRDSVVVYPPVDVSRFSAGAHVDDFYLVVSRLVGYKRVDLAVQACSATGRRLIVAGDGPARRQLQSIAGPSVEFVGRVEDEAVADLLRRCRALLFCGEEDFGIAPVEAMASGRPVVAYGVGGALETVLDGVTGAFFLEQNIASVVAALDRIETLEVDASACIVQALKFSPEVFRKRLEDVVSSAIEGKVVTS